jgi:hypothetical protein
VRLLAVVIRLLIQNNATIQIMMIMNFKNVSKKALRVLAAASIIVAFSSCNRGYGCPSNFSLGDFFQDLVIAVVAFLF